MWKWVVEVHCQYFLCRDPIIDYVRNNDEIDPIVRKARSKRSRKTENRQNAYLNLPYGCIWWEMMSNSTSRMCIDKFDGEPFGFWEFFCVAFGFGFLMWFWVQAQKKGRVYYLLPCVLKIMYCTFVYLTGIGFIMYATSCKEFDNQCASFELVQDVCHFILHRFPFNMHESDTKLVFRESQVEYLVSWRQWAIGYQLVQFVLLVKCWRIISSWRKGGTLWNYKALTNNDLLELEGSSQPIKSLSAQVKVSHYQTDGKVKVFEFESSGLSVHPSENILKVPMDV